MRTTEQNYFRFTFVSTSTPTKKVVVYVPFKTTISSPAKDYEIDLSKNSDSSLDTLESLTTQTGTGLSLSAFNFLDKIDYGHFYQVANSKISPTVTLLVSHFDYVIKDVDITKLDAYSDSVTDALIVAAGSGDKLCYGSYSQGIFQTHMRESYPLWIAWIGILFYWLYNLITEANEINCYDKKFEDNKYTCWGFYSLNRLGHEEYFTKLSRSTLMLITFSWQGLCIAILYNEIGADYNNGKIMWFAIIGFITSVPFTFVMGYFFLTQIYKVNLHKFDVLKTMKGIFNKKDGMDTYEKEIDNAEETLYGLYYWFYVLAAVFFTVFWTLAVHFMMQLPRENYVFHKYFLASMAIAFALEHLIFDPLLTIIFGDTVFYRSRGFYYDFRLGERFKEIEE